MDTFNDPAYGRSGCYGKIPRLGDFLSRSLPRSLITSLDEWLQEGMRASQQQLGAHWVDAYLVSPVWCFAAGPGCFDPSAWLGVMVPSVDRVGRYFPFLVLVEAGELTPCQALYLCQAWYTDAESLALDSLEEDFDPASLEQRLSELRAGEAFWTRQADRPTSANESGRRYRIGAAATIRDVLAGIADDALEELYPASSLWWTRGSERIDPCLLLTQGLPGAGSFAAYFDGRFEGAGWGDGGVLGRDEPPEAGQAPIGPEP